MMSYTVKGKPQKRAKKTGGGTNKNTLGDSYKARTVQADKDERSAFKQGTYWRKS